MLEQLKPDFRERAEAALEACLARGVEMRPYCAQRSPEEQGRLWRQSRSRETVERKITELRRQGATYLAYCIDVWGSQYGRPVTNAIPGLSWHQWAEALDCYWLVDGRAEWSTKRGGKENGYVIWAEEAVRAGLVAGGLWPRLKDWAHVQGRQGSVLEIYSLQEINNEMRQRTLGDSRELLEQAPGGLFRRRSGKTGGSIRSRPFPRGDPSCTS